MEIESFLEEHKKEIKEMGVVDTKSLVILLEDLGYDCYLRLDKEDLEFKINTVLKNTKKVVFKKYCVIDLESFLFEVCELINVLGDYDFRD